MENTDLLSFKLLGGLSIKRNGTALGNLASRKAEALLVYLVCNRQEHSRESLATLLWDDRPLSRSLGNLSVLLTSLRKEAAPFVHLGRNSLSFNLESNYHLDSQRFEEKINLARKQQSNQPLRTAAALLTQALEIYQGLFLAGFYIREAREFEEWMVLEQERLQRLAIDGLADLVDFHLMRNQTQEGIEQAARLLALDPLREAGHRQMMRLLALDGQRNAALAQFESCRKILADELGVEPAETTVDLYEQVRSGDWVGDREGLGEESLSVPILYTPTRSNMSPHNLPIQTTTFIGRENELVKIAHRLEEPACRLLTLVGPGGIGKTRLALEAANRQVGRFLHGVWFVGLAGLSSGEGVVSAIADTLGLSYTDRADLEEELLAYLRQKEMLLLLDNFEQLLEEDTAPDLIQTILQKAPNITFLVTSREHISLLGEWLVSIDGLPFPTEADGEKTSRFAAVQLFIQRAQQFDSDFSDAVAPMDAVQKICQLVQGTPLALELAATWLRVYSCEQVAKRIEEDLRFLSTRMRNVPARHRSLQAVFDYSWQLLSLDEQELLRRLVVFQDGFTNRAVLQVANATEDTLAALVDKSLIRQESSAGGRRRYQIHEILRQFAAVRLAEDRVEEIETLDNHARYFAQFCHKQETNLKRGRVLEALEIVAEDLENLKAAWRWAFGGNDSPDLGLLAQMMEGFFVFFEMRGRFREGLGLSEDAAAAVAAGPPHQEGVVLGRLLAWQGWFNFRLSNYEKGQAMAERGLAMTQAEGAWQYTAYPLLFLGAAAFGMGKLEKAESFFQQSLDIYRRLDDDWGIGGNLLNLGHVFIARGNYETAESHLLESLAVTEVNDISYLHSRGLQTLGRLYTIMGKYETARSSMEETLKVSRSLGDKYSVAMTLLDLGRLEMQLENLDAAVSYLHQGQAVFSEIGDRLNEYWAVIHLGDIAFKQKALSRAQQYWGTALQLGREIQASAIILAAVKGIAQLHMINGNGMQALALLAFVKDHRDADHQTREEANALFEEAAGQFEDGEIKSAKSLAASWDLEGLTIFQTFDGRI